MTTESRWFTEPTFWARIYCAGCIETAKTVCREECLREGLCVTVEPCHYIYTGGMEAGFVVGLINYPRFPSSAQSITDRAKLISGLLMERCCQTSALVMTPNETHWVTRRKDNNSPGSTT